MLGIGKEALIFLYAGLSGIVILLCYQILRLFRRLILHHIVIVNLEDLLYWLGVSIYLFRQMYRTTYGSIRLLANFALSLAKKMYRKIKKGLEKRRKNR